MIHLDTCALIGLPALGARGRGPLWERVRAGEGAAACSWAWYEFACGPLGEGELDAVRDFIGGNIVGVTGRHAERAAALFNATGRRRGTRADCLIAAVALAEGAELATLNGRDFAAFRGQGLRVLVL